MAGNLVLTRPAGSNAQLQVTLKQAGMRTLEAPLIEIQGLDPAIDPKAPLETVIFTSQNAVKHARGLIQRLQNTSRGMVFAVGAATKQMLASHSVPALAPLQPGSEFLLQLEDLQQVRGKRITIVTGRAGRGLLESELTARGAKVERYECYERLPLDPPELERLLQDGEFDHVLVTSVDVLTALMSCIGKSLYTKITLVVTAARIAEAAASEGFTDLIEVQGVGAAEILEAVSGVRLARERFDHEG